jgi:hypothetical protein
MCHRGGSRSASTSSSAKPTNRSRRPGLVPFRTVRRLDEASTKAIIEDGADIGGKLIKTPHRMVPGGGICVLHREHYEQAPLDPRFVGWGHEDECWGLGLRHLLGDPTITGDILWHLYHPPADKSHTPDNRARRKPAEMNSLLSRAWSMLADEDEPEE